MDVILRAFYGSVFINWSLSSQKIEICSLTTNFLSIYFSKNCRRYRFCLSATLTSFIMTTWTPISKSVTTIPFVNNSKAITCNVTPKKRTCKNQIRVRTWALGIGSHDYICEWLYQPVTTNLLSNCYAVIGILKRLTHPLIDTYHTN